MYNVRGGGLGTVLQAGRSLVRFQMRSVGFLNDLILPAALWLFGVSASARNEYQECHLGGRGWVIGLCVGLTTLPPSCAICLEILGV